jgi:hypothetical protein
MAYGTADGVGNNLFDYTQLMDASSITTQMVSECRYYSDGIIDARLAKVVPVQSLTLDSPPAVINCVSDDLTTYFLLRRLFTGKDPNDSQWVDKFYVRPLELLDALVKDPGIIQVADVPSESAARAVSTTLNSDRVFSVTTTSGGSITAGSGEGTEDKW